MARGDWMKNLTPEQRKERAAKMRAAKAAKPKIYELDPSAIAPTPPPLQPESERLNVPAPQPVVLATPSEMQYLKTFRNLLNEYLNALSGLNALGMPSVIDYCRMCAGNGIHLIGCGCVCHRARKAMQEFANEFGPKMEMS